MAFDVGKVGNDLKKVDTWLWFAPLGFLTVWLATWLSSLVSWGDWEMQILGAISAVVIAAVWSMVRKAPSL